jgi:hypothetical protein
MDFDVSLLQQETYRRALKDAILRLEDVAKLNYDMPQWNNAVSACINAVKELQD